MYLYPAFRRTEGLEINRVISDQNNGFKEIRLIIEKLNEFENARRKNESSEWFISLQIQISSEVNISLHTFSMLHQYIFNYAKLLQYLLFVIIVKHRM